MKKAPLFLLLLSLILGCETTIDIEIPLEPASLVVNSTLVDGEFIKVNVSESQHILDGKKFKFVLGASVEIYENGELIEVLPDSLEGNYISNKFKAKKGGLYNVIVSKNGFETASSQVLMPFDTAEILSVKLDTIIINEFDYSSSYLRFSIEIKDDGKIDNFYKVSVFRGEYYERYNYDVDPPVLIDTAYSYQQQYIQSRDPSLEEFQSYGESILFNDELFNGGTYKMNVLLPTWIDPDHSGSGDYDDGIDYFIELSSTSESYYLHELSFELQYWTSDNPFAQPVTVYNNIENGFGIFGAYNTAVYKVEK